MNWQLWGRGRWMRFCFQKFNKEFWKRLRENILVYYWGCINRCRRNLIIRKWEWCAITFLCSAGMKKLGLTLLNTDCWFGLKGVLGTLFDPPPSHPAIHRVTPPWSSANSCEDILKRKNTINTRQESKSPLLWLQKKVNMLCNSSSSKCCLLTAYRENQMPPQTTWSKCSGHDYITEISIIW